MMWVRHTCSSVKPSAKVEGATVSDRTEERGDETERWPHRLRKEEKDEEEEQDAADSPYVEHFGLESCDIV